MRSAPEHRQAALDARAGAHPAPHGGRWRTPSLGAALLLWVAAVTGGGCASVTYRVPGTEVQRLAQLPPMERGQEVRIVPRNARLSPSTAGRKPIGGPPVAGQVSGPLNGPHETPPRGPYAELPPQDPRAIDPRAIYPPAIGPPAIGPPAIDPPAINPPPISDEPTPEMPPPAMPLYDGPPPPASMGGPVLDVEVSVPIRGPAPVRGGGVVRTRPAPPPYRLASAPMPRVGGSAWRGTPPVPNRVTPAPRPAGLGPPRGSFRVGSTERGFGRRGGGGGGRGNGAAAAAIGVVAVVGLVATVAVAADHAQRIADAHAFDGWVGVAPCHLLHLHYLENGLRSIPLCELQPEDTVGVRYAVLSAGNGRIQPLARADGSSR